MRRKSYPDVLEIWGVTWTKAGTVWVGPAITEPEDPMLALSVAYERIIHQDGRYVMVDPSITLDRFGWDEDAAEGMTITHPDGSVEPLGDATDEEEDEAC